MNFNGIRPSYTHRTNIVPTRGPRISADERLGEVRSLCHVHFAYIRGVAQDPSLEPADIGLRVTQSLRNLDKRLRQGGLRTSLYQCRSHGYDFMTSVHRDIRGDARFIAELQQFAGALSAHPALLRGVSRRTMHDTVYEHIDNLRNHEHFAGGPHPIYNWYQPGGERSGRPL